MKTNFFALVLCLLLAGISQSAPLETVFFEYNGVLLRTDGDEHGLVTRDAQGRVAIEDDSVWYYASLSSSFQVDLQPVLVKVVEVSPAGIAPELAAYSDPEVDQKIRAFNASAPYLESRVFLGEIQVTVVLVTFNPFTPPNFWNGPQGQVIDDQFTYAQIFSQNLRAEYPSDSARTNLSGDVIYGSAAEWFNYNSGGLVNLVPDLSRYPAGYVGNPDQPGVITDPLNPGQAIPIPGSLLNDVVVFETLEARGIDCTPDPRRLMIFLNRSYWSSRADFSGIAWLNLYHNIQGQALLTPGVIVHEICHASLGLPDLYNDMAELKNAHEIMSMGCHGYQYQDSTGVFRRHRGFPGLIEEPFAEVLGWRETLPITAPGVYTFDANFSPFCIQNPTDPREKIFIRSWNDEQGWLSRHQPLTSDGRLLIEYTDFHRPALHYFQDLPAPFLKWANPNSEVWPTGDQHVPALHAWNNGEWFPWIIDTDECRAGDQPRSFEILERPAPYPCVSMVYQDLMEEVPLGGAPLNLQLLNMGTAFSGWSLNIGDMTVSSEEAIAFNQSFTASFPAEVWNASALGQVLDLPVVLNIQSLDTSLVVGRLQPFVGLAPADWRLVVDEDVVTAASGEYHLVADASSIRLFIDGQERAQHSLLNAQEIRFSADPHRAVARGHLNGSDVLTILAVDDDVVDILVSIFCFPGISAYALTEWNGEQVLVFVRGDQFEVRRLYGSHAPIFQYTLPDYILPVKQMACAFGDPAGDLGLRFGMIGGEGNSWMHVTNVSGDTLYSRFAGECSELRNILALDPLGSGYYSFIVDNMVCAGGNWDTHYDEVLWCVSYSESQGHYGAGIFPLGIYNSTSEDGAEDFVPYPHGDFPYRHAILTNSHHPYQSVSEIQMLDVSRNTPQLTVIAQEAPRNRWFSVGYFDADTHPDAYVFDRGAGMRFFRGSGDNVLGLIDSGRLHAFESREQHPQFVEMNGEQKIVFYEDGALQAYHLPFAQAPTYSGNGVGNQRFMPNPNWQSAGDSPLSPPRIRATFIPGNQVRLDIEPLALGQMASSLSVWFSLDQVTWTKVSERFWDGLASTYWVDQQALRGRHLGFYRAQVSNQPDNQVFWTE